METTRFKWRMSNSSTTSKANSLITVVITSFWTRESREQGHFNAFASRRLPKARPLISLFLMEPWLKRYCARMKRKCSAFWVWPSSTRNSTLWFLWLYLWFSGLSTPVSWRLCGVSQRASSSSGLPSSSALSTLSTTVTPTYMPLSSIKVKVQSCRTLSSSLTDSKLATRFLKCSFKESIRTSTRAGSLISATSSFLRTCLLRSSLQLSSVHFTFSATSCAPGTSQSAVVRLTILCTRRRRLFLKDYYYA